MQNYPELPKQISDLNAWRALKAWSLDRYSYTILPEFLMELGKIGRRLD